MIQEWFLTFFGEGLGIAMMLITITFLFIIVFGIAIYFLHKLLSF